MVEETDLIDSWIKSEDGYYYDSNDGQHRICKTGPASNERFTLWRRKGERFTIVDVFHRFSDALRAVPA